MKHELYAKDVESIDAIIKAFYDVVSGPAGQERNWERDDFLHAQGARILIPEKASPHTSFMLYSLEAYHQRAKRLVDEGFFEEEIHRVTEQFDTMAHVWSTYQYRDTPEGPIAGRGINSIQLFHQEGRWWISSWSFVSESEAFPLPEKYLPK